MIFARQDIHVNSYIELLAFEKRGRDSCFTEFPNPYDEKLAVSFERFLLLSFFFFFKSWKSRLAALRTKSRSHRFAFDSR